MKHYFSAAFLAVALLAGLTACGGNADAQSTAPPSSASATATSTPSPTPSPTHSPRAVPDVTGKKFPEARKILNAAGFYGSPWGKDGKKWTNSTPDESLQVVSTTPAAGTVTTTEDIRINLGIIEADNARVAKEAAEAAQLAVRYLFDCGPLTWSSTGSDKYHTLKEVWASKHYAGSDKCRVTIGGVGIYEHPVLNPGEQKIADVVAAHGGGGGGSAPSDFGRVLELCTKLESDYADQIVARMDWKKAEAAGALALCPDAPHAAVLQGVLDSVKIGDGTHTVGADMEPGTYQTKPSIKDCYWSRTTGGGGIIANDFVGFAPAGVTVTVYPGEGFESARCGVWTKVG